MHSARAKHTKPKTGPDRCLNPRKAVMKSKVVMSMLPATYRSYVLHSRKRAIAETMPTEARMEPE